MTDPIRIAGRPVGPGHPCYLVAEVGASHGGSFDRALALVREAKAVGADAVKLQVYEPQDMTLDVDHPAFRVPAGSPWAGERLWDLYARAQTPPGWLPDLFAAAREADLPCFATPFHPRHVALLEDLGAPAYKVASFEIGWPDLLREVGRTGKPVILSTGGATLDEVFRAAWDVWNARGDEDGVALLHCVSAYPAPLAAMNLRAIPELAERTACPVGLSDHTRDVLVPVAAVALGACVWERHLKLAGDETSPDAAFASDPVTWTAAALSIRWIEAALGAARSGPVAAEAASAAFRRRRLKDGRWVRCAWAPEDV